ncbi:MAG TPA: O-antigen ligase family protein [Bryobacteraceae bacterium]|nr:O-antigen ligase family protein [Bryobacteraceae bacterium]
MSDRGTDTARLNAAGWILPALLGAYAAIIALAPKPGMALVLAAPLALLPLAYWTTLRPDRWLFLFFAAVLLLPPLPFGWGNSGPHPSVVFILFGLLAGLFGLGGWCVAGAPLNRALGVFFLVLLASTAEAVFYSGAKVGLGSLVRVMLFGISVYVFFYTAYSPAARAPHDVFAQVRRLYWIAVAAALFACVDFYFQLPAPAGFGQQYIWLRSGVYRRAQGLFYEASTLGNFCVFFLVMIAAALFARRQEAPIARLWLWLGGAVFAAALVLSYSRGSLLNALVALAVLIWLHRSRMRWGRLVLVAAGFAVAALLVLRALLPAFTFAYLMRVSASVQYVFSETEGLLSGRVASWRAVLEFLAQHPWHALFGIGYKTLPYTDYLGAKIITDNMYLSLLAETGIAGLAALIWLSVEILRSARRAAGSTDARRRFFGSWILAFWAGQVVQMFTGDLLTYWRVLPLYFWVLAVAIRDEHSLP